MGATASRVSLVVQQDPSPVKSPREEGQQMEEEEAENEEGVGMDNEASVSSDPSQIEHPDGDGEMDEEDNGGEDAGNVDIACVFSPIILFIHFSISIRVFNLGGIATDGCFVVHTNALLILRFLLLHLLPFLS